MMVLAAGCATSKLVIPQTVKLERKSDDVNFSTFVGLLIRPERDTQAIQLSEEEQDRVSYVADSVRFWDLPEKLQPAFGVIVTPNSGQNFMRVKTDKHDHTVYWNGAQDPGYAAPGDRAFRLRGLIDSIIGTRPPVPESHRSKRIKM